MLEHMLTTRVQRTALQKEMDEQMAEINTYKSLPMASQSQTKTTGKAVHEVCSSETSVDLQG